MTAAVLLAVLVAAVVHASWNAAAHTIDDELAGLTLVGAGRVACGLTLAVAVPAPDPASWPWLAASAVLHVVYQILLVRSFALGDFGQVYPIARGTAPIVVTLVATTVLGERLHPLTLAGIAVTMAGLVGLALWGYHARRADAPRSWPGIVAALGTGLTIAAYTVVDGVGVRAAVATAGYVAWLMISDGIAVPTYATVRHGTAILRRARPVVAKGLIAGALSVLSYGLILWAQAHAQLAPVAVLRESSILVGAAIATFCFRERFGAPRAVAAGVVLAGITLILAR
ncbi:DMT family transporter [Dactylosporangium sp. NPDC000555]|uniref:DMT family transporter n=1 Tax=Dactylosporangium sp. NPDC000555 TaxID=3154260 RepID=UPI00332CC5CB